MKKRYLLFFLLLLIPCYLIAQSSDWRVMPGSEDSVSYHILSKQDGNITYIVDSDLSIPDRERFVANTKKYIASDLDLLQETDFDIPVWIMLNSDRSKRYKYGIKTLYSVERDDVSNITLISSFYDPEHCPLNLGLMKVIAAENWGKINDIQLTWLEEGLAAYATSEAYNCDGYSFEKKYVGFLQEGKLLTLLQFPKETDRVQYKIACNQSAYMVEYLLKYYGTGKLKQLWQESMSSFEDIYGIVFEDLIIKINKELNRKYSIPLGFNWNIFSLDCVGPQPDGWVPAYCPPVYHDLDPIFNRMETKEVGNLKFTVNSTMPIPERDSLIVKAKKYIAKNLELINEQPFNDSIHIVAIPDRNGMKALGFDGFSGTAALKDGIVIMENIVYAVFNTKQSALKHELMHIVSLLKWGDNPYTLNWLREGLATFADPTVYDCDGHTIEDRYVYFLQNDRLIDTEILLTQFFADTLDDIIGNKTAYNQSAYIVGYLIENYGIEKLKQLWQNSILDFEKIYGLSFDDLVRKINQELNEKYPEKIEFNREGFSKRCV